MSGLQLLENSIATMFGLAVLILVFGPVSGAHFNPLVSLADWALGLRSGSGPPAATSWRTSPLRSGAGSPGRCWRT